MGGQSSHSTTTSDIKGCGLLNLASACLLSVLDGHLRLGEREGTSSKGAD